MADLQMEHGNSRYANRKCRCDVCRAAHASYERERLRAKPKEIKGSSKIYYTNPCANCGKIVVKRNKHEAAKRKFCSKPCFFEGRELKGLFEVGHEVFYRNPGHSEETKAKMREVNRANARRGPDNANWRGGKRTERKRAMGSFEYRDWRQAVFNQDDYTCRSCGVRGSWVHADHIVDWATDVSLRYEVCNGQTLCYKCHFEKTFGYRDDEKALRWGVPTNKRAQFEVGENNF